MLERSGAGAMLTALRVQMVSLAKPAAWSLGSVTRRQDQSLL